MRIAITGASGLVGHAMATELAARGHELVRVGRGADSDVRFDLAGAPLPPNALAGCEALVHAAGVTDEDFSDPRRAWAKAVDGAAALLAAAPGAAAVAYVSSAHVYGPLEGTLDEASPVNPLSDYAIAHFATEQVFRRHARGERRLLLARPCAVYGIPPALERFARWSLVPFDFPRQALAGRIVLRSPGLQQRNFVAVDALAAGIAQWIGVAGGGATVANFPGAATLSIYDFARLCARITTEMTRRPCEVVRPEPSGEPPAPLRYLSRTAATSGTSLEDHVRAMVASLSRKASP